MQGLKEYVRSDKKWHRAWVWQQAAKMCRTPVRQARILYLVGPNPEDHKVFVRRGFSLNRSWGCDLVLENVKACRAAGFIALKADIIDLLMYGRGVHFDVVYLDFCCGITDTVDIVRCLLGGSQIISQDTVVAINLLRGREAGWRVNIRDLEDSYSHVVLPGGPVGKHRGKLFAIDAITEAVGMEALYSGRQSTSDDLLQMYRKCRPQFASYVSGPQRMDSVVMYPAWHQRCEEIEPGQFRDAMDSLRGKLEGIDGVPTHMIDSMDRFHNSFDVRKERKKCMQVRRFIAAAKAVETMRLQGTLRS